VFEIAPPSVDTELGYQHRENPNSSHGGISVKEFLEEAIAGIKNDELETMVGMAKQLRTASEEMFKMINR
jgi:uncharacterized oxidoreductase